jgi:hypothetical protein
VHRTLENPEKTGSPSFLKSKRTWVKGGCSTRFRTKCGHSEFTFDRASAERSAEQGVVSETIAAALYLISENRKATRSWLSLSRARWSWSPSVVQRWPDCFRPTHDFFLAFSGEQPSRSLPMASVRASCSTQMSPE